MMTQTKKSYDFGDIRQLILAGICWFIYVFFRFKIIAIGDWFALYTILIINGVLTLQVLGRLIVGIYRSLVQTISQKTDSNRASWFGLIIAILFFIIISSVNSIERDFHFLHDELQSVVTNVVTGEIQPKNDGYLPNMNRSNSSFRKVKAEYYNQNWVIKFTRHTVGFGDGRANYLYYSGNEDLSELFKKYGKKINLYIPHDKFMSAYTIDKIRDHWFWEVEYW